MRVSVATCCLHGEGLLALNLPVNPKSLKNPTPRLLFLALAGPFCVLGNLEKPEESKLNSERREWVLRDIGGPSSAYWTVDAVREEEVDVKPTVGSGGSG